MPWTCRTCTIDIALDTEPCPGCGDEKLAWTVVEDQTRTFTVGSGRRFDLWVGDGAEPRTREQAAAPLNLDLAERVPVISKEAARALMADGLLPASQDVLLVGLTPGRWTDLTVEIEPLFDTQPSEPLAFPWSEGEPSEPTVYAAFVFVCGEGDASEIAFAGISVVDVSEASAEGHAPLIEFTALGLDAQELPADTGPWIELELVDAFDRPAAGEAYRLTFPDGTVLEGVLDGAGCARVIGLPEGQPQVAFPNHERWERVES